MTNLETLTLIFNIVTAIAMLVSVVFLGLAVRNLHKAEQNLRRR